MVVNLVLLIDDDDDMRSLLCDTIQSRGYRVLEFRSPKEALAEIRTGKVQSEISAGRFPIILSDNLMPGSMSGIDFLKVVRNENPGIPFILMTAFGSDDVFNQAKAAGASSYLKKPFSIDELFERLSRARTMSKKMGTENDNGLR